MQEKPTSGCGNVQVDADARHAGHSESPRQDVVEEGQDPAADAGVDMASEPAIGGNRRDLRDRSDHAVGVGRCGPDDEHGVLADGVRHGPGIRAKGHGVDVDRAITSTPK